MDIKNVTEFRNFVSSNGLANSSPEVTAAILCVMDYERGCSCWKNDERKKIYNNCKILYSRAVSVVVRNLRHQFISKTADQIMTFYQDGISIGSIRR